MITHSSLHTARLLDAVRKVDNKARTIIERLASGLRVNDMGDDPAALVQVTLLSADRRSLGQTLVNINEGISLGSVAQDGLDHIAALLEQMDGLAVEAAKVYIGTPERLVLNNHYLDYRAQIETIAAETTYNHIHALDGSMAGGTPAQPAEVTAPVAQSTTLTSDETVVFEDWGIFSGLSAAARTISFSGLIPGTPATAGEVVAPVAQTQALRRGERLEFENWGIFAGMTSGQRRISLSEDWSQAQVVNAINNDAWIGPLVQASVNASGQLVLTSVATGASAAFRVSSNQAAAADTTGLGLALLQGAGVDGAEGTGGMEIQAGQHHQLPHSVISVEIDAATLAALGLTGSSIDTAENALAAITEVDGAREEVLRVTGQVDAMVSRLAFAANASLSGQAESHKAILRIQTVDEAQDVIDLTVTEIIQNSARAMVAQARITPEMALSLL